MRRWWIPACLCAALIAAGCEEPPNKEIDQAQGAIDAARAAGADRYATGEFKAATDALARANQAVTGRDYRQALNDALESGEHARNAAREAADTKARLRGEAERLVTEVNTLLEQAARSMAAAERARVPRSTLRTHQDSVASATSRLQEARTALSAGDYAATSEALNGTKAQIAAVIRALDATESRQTPRRRR